MLTKLYKNSPHCLNQQSPPGRNTYREMSWTKKGNKYIFNNMLTLKCASVGFCWLDAQLVGDGHDHFENRHEGRDLAEVAAADHLGVDLQAPLVVLARHAAADLVEAVQDVLRELQGE